MKQRALSRGRRRPEGESVFVSMTDMTVSFLFIVMILLAFFASQYNDDTVVSKTLHDYELKVRDESIEELQILTEKLRKQIREQGQKLAEKRKQLHKQVTIVSEQKKRLDEQAKRLAKQEKRLAEQEELLAKLSKIDPLEQYMLQASAARLRLLDLLQQRLKDRFPNLPVDVIPEEGALRFQGEGLFESGSFVLDTQRQEVIRVLADTLNDLLPCFTFARNGQEWRQSCNPSYSIIEAVQIEGHTDSQGDDLYNLTLSTNRAVTTFATMIANTSSLLDWENVRDQPVLSVAGYGKMRPVADNESADGRATNRRVDMRIIMYAPASSDEVENIKARLQGIFGGGNDESR